MAKEDIAHVRRGTPFTEDELVALSLRFERLDRDRTGTLSAEELLAIPEFAMNPLAPRVLQVLGLQDAAELNFVAFVRFLAVFHPDSPAEDKLDLAFRLYDLDGDGVVRPAELLHVVRLMAGGERLLKADELVAVVERTFAAAPLVNGEPGITRDSFPDALRLAGPSYDLFSAMTVSYTV
jgi:Ca2+-binding EF-hand superfamily protein